MTGSTGTVFRYVLPMLKSEPNVADGSIEHVGIASTASEDLEGDEVDQELVAKSYDLLARYGKFCWDHGKEDVGDVFGCRQIDPVTALDEFGIVIKSRGTAVWGNVYPIVDPGLAHEDLKRAHHRLRSGARLGYSLDGLCVRDRGGRITKAMFHRIAITPQPMNLETRAWRLTKSLRAVADDIGVSDDALPEVLSELPGPPEILVDGMGERQGLTVDQVSITKSLFEALVRAAFGPRQAPPLGHLKAALERLRGERQ